MANDFPDSVRALPSDRAAAASRSNPQAVSSTASIPSADGKTAEEALADLLAVPFPPVIDEDDTLGSMLDNQAWIVLSHVASRIGLRDGDPGLMERWQDAWSDGIIQQGYFSPHRAVAAWIAQHCQLIPAQAIPTGTAETACPAPFMGSAVRKDAPIGDADHD